MNSCNKCLYNNDDICQNDKCSFDSEDNCYEFEDISTYNKGYQQGRADLLTEFKKQGAYDIIRLADAYFQDRSGQKNIIIKLCANMTEKKQNPIRMGMSAILSLNRTESTKM